MKFPAHRRRRALVLLAGAVVLALAGCSPPQPEQQDTVLRFAVQDVLESADPYFNQQVVGSSVADHVFDGLIYRNTATGNYEGNLATAWRRVDDLTLEFDLRRNVRFHNGEPFDADDVVYSINFLANPANKAVYLSLIRWLDHAEKVDDYTVRIKSREPFPAAIAYLSNPFLAIQPNEYYARVGRRGVNAAPVGTGPYRVVQHQPGKSIRMVRNEDFHEGPKRQPTIQEILIRFIPDAQTRVAEAVAGGVDFITRVALDQAVQLKHTNGIKVTQSGSYFYHLLRLNTRDGSPAPQLRDIRVRRAIMHAIDREAIANHLAGEGSQIIQVACHPLHFGCSDAMAPRYDYDPMKARQLLAQAGYPHGFAIDLYAYNNRNQSEALLGYLQAVGIDAGLRFLQFPAVRTATRANRAALIHAGLGMVTLDVANSTSPYFEGSPDDVNHDTEVSVLLERGDAALDPSVREQAYAKALGLIADRAYALPLFTEPFFHVTSDRLVFQPTADGYPHFYEMDWR